jgi:hypothetical protein
MESKKLVVASGDNESQTGTQRNYDAINCHADNKTKGEKRGSQRFSSFLNIKSTRATKIAAFLLVAVLLALGNRQFGGYIDEAQQQGTIGAAFITENNQEGQDLVGTDLVSGGTVGTYDQSNADVSFDLVTPSIDELGESDNSLVVNEPAVVVLSPVSAPVPAPVATLKPTKKPPFELLTPEQKKIATDATTALTQVETIISSWPKDPLKATGKQWLQFSASVVKVLGKYSSLFGPIGVGISIMAKLFPDDPVKPVTNPFVIEVREAFARVEKQLDKILAGLDEVRLTFCENTLDNDISNYITDFETAYNAWNFTVSHSDYSANEPYRWDQLLTHCKEKPAINLLGRWHKIFTDETFQDCHEEILMDSGNRALYFEREWEKSLLGFMISAAKIDGLCMGYLRADEESKGLAPQIEQHPISRYTTEIGEQWKKDKAAMYTNDPVGNTAPTGWIRTLNTKYECTDVDCILTALKDDFFDDYLYTVVQVTKAKTDTPRSIVPFAEGDKSVAVKSNYRWSNGIKAGSFMMNERFIIFYKKTGTSTYNPGFAKWHDGFSSDCVEEGKQSHGSRSVCYRKWDGSNKCSHKHCTDPYILSQVFHNDTKSTWDIFKKRGAWILRTSHVTYISHLFSWERKERPDLEARIDLTKGIPYKYIVAYSHEQWERRYDSDIRKTHDQAAYTIIYLGGSLPS